MNRLKIKLPLNPHTIHARNTTPAGRHACPRYINIHPVYKTVFQPANPESLFPIPFNPIPPTPT
jgi:hypothetical protein